MSFIVFVSFTTSCEELFNAEEELSEEEKIDDIIDIDAPLDNLTPEQQKTEMTNTGVEFVSEISNLMDQEAFNVASGLMKRMDNAETKLFKNNTPVQGIVNVLEVMASAKNGESSPISILEVMEVEAEEPSSLKEQWDELVGVYEFDLKNNELPEEPTSKSDKIIIKFPSSETATTNDCRIEISNFKSQTFSSDIVDDLDTEDLPLSIKAELFKSDKSIMSYEMSASYKSDGIPTAISSTLKMGVFSFNVSGKNEDNDIAADWSFKKDQTTLMAIGAFVVGKFTESAFEDAEDTEDPTKVISSGGAYLTIMNMKLGGKVKFTELYNEAEKISDKYSSQYEAIEDEYNKTWNWEKYDADMEKVEMQESKEMIPIINKYVEIALINTTRNKTVCKGEVIWDDTDDNVSIRLVFDDDSKEDITTYFDDENTFKPIIDKFEELTTKMNNKFPMLEETEDYEDDYEDDYVDYTPYKK